MLPPGKMRSCIGNSEYRTHTQDIWKQRSLQGGFQILRIFSARELAPFFAEFFLLKICGIEIITKFYRVLQSIAEYCRAFQIITEYYKVLQSIAEYCRVLPIIADYYRVLQRITEYCRVLQSIAEDYRVLQSSTE